MGGNESKNSKKKIEFKEIEELINLNRITDKNIIKIYNDIKNNIILKKQKNLFYYISSNYKSLFNFIPISKQKENFVKYIFFILYNDNNLSLFEDYLQNYYKNNKKEFYKLILCYNPPYSMRYILYKTMKKIIINDEKKLFYKNLSEEENTIDLKNEDYIKKDIYRTFNKEKISEENIKKLENILINFTKIDKTIGYCQGMNFIVGFFLKITDFDEIESFYLFLNFFQNIRGFYINNFPLYKIYLYIFNYHFKIFFPNIFKHFEKNELSLEFWVGKWFQTLFIINCPHDIVCKIFDYLYIFDISYLLSFTFSILYFYEKDLLELKDNSDIIYFFNEILYPKNNLKKISYYDIKNNIINLDSVFKQSEKYYKIIQKDFEKLKMEYIDKNNIKIEDLYKNYEILINNDNNIKKKGTMTITTTTDISDLFVNIENESSIHQYNNNNRTNKNIIDDNFSDDIVSDDDSLVINNLNNYILNTEH